MTQLRILVVGAGIAGLAAKRALSMHGIDAEVVERDLTPRMSGAGLYLPANAVRALGDLGLSAQLAELAQPILRQELRDERGQILAEFPVSAIWGSVGECMAMRRTDLHRMLLEAVGPEQVRFGIGVCGVGPDGRVTFTDGSQATYDLIIGADGLNSVVRHTALTDAQPRYLGQVTWRFLAPSRGLEPNTWTVMLGNRGRTFLSVPVGSGQVYCSAAMDSTEPDRPPAAWRSQFWDFAGPAKVLLTWADQAHYAPLYEVRAFEHSHPHVALIGDAAHACSPSMSQAAAMGAEDALVLAETVAEAPMGTSVPAMLEAYRERRGERLRFVQEQNHRRDQARHLPGFVRRVLFRHFAQGIYRSNHKALMTRP